MRILLYRCVCGPHTYAGKCMHLKGGDNQDLVRPHQHITPVLAGGLRIDHPHSDVWRCLIAET